MWNAVYPYLAALLPTIGLLVVCYVVFRTIFQADRRERRAVALWEREHGGHAGGPRAQPSAAGEAGSPEVTGDPAQPGVPD